MPLSSVRRSTARLPSNADEVLALAVTDPLSAVVFTSKVPPTVIGQVTRTALCSTRHSAGAASVAPVTASATSVDFIERPCVCGQRIEKYIAAVEAGATSVPTIDG